MVVRQDAFGGFQITWHFLSTSTAEMTLVQSKYVTRGA